MIKFIREAEPKLYPNRARGTMAKTRMILVQCECGHQWEIQYTNRDRTKHCAGCAKAATRRRITSDHYPRGENK